MATTTVYKFRYHCPLDTDPENYYRTAWGTTPPTNCPIDNTVLDPDSVVIVDTVSTNQVVALEDSQGYYQATSICMDIPAGATGSITTMNVSWPCDILLWTSAMYVPSDSAEDVFNLVASPDTTIGYITVGCTGAPSNVFHVSSTVTANVQRGLDISLYDGVHRNDLGRVTAIDSTNGTITTELNATNCFNAGTLVFLNVHTVRDLRICNALASSGGGISLGAKGQKGKMIPANLVMQLRYTNNNGLAKMVAWKIEYYLVG